MNKHCFNSSICKSAVFIATLVVSGLIAESALAKRVSFTATVSQVRSACSKVGGSFEVHIDGRGYGCVNKNCDGQGGTCQVQCNNNNNCNGSTPGRKQQGGKPVQILTNSSGHTTTPGNSPSANPGGPFDGGILGSGSGLGTTGPAATGSHMGTGSRPSAAAPIQLR
jgi:hypothetical protein